MAELEYWENHRKPWYYLGKWYPEIKKNYLDPLFYNMQKIISGLSTRTTNENHQSYKDLEALRWKFMKRDLKSAFWENLVSPLVYAVYTNYEKDFQSWAYDVYLWFETKSTVTDFDSLIVDEENFKIFEFEYTTAQDVTNAREKIWSLTDLPRKYSFDLEEYDFANKKFRIYISLK